MKLDDHEKYSGTVCVANYAIKSNDNSSDQLYLYFLLK